MTTGPRVDLFEAVAAAAREAFGEAELLELEPVAGGHSGVTHSAMLRLGSEVCKAVVKSSPPGRPAAGRHDVLRQARIVEALGRASTVPVPPVLFTATGPPAIYGSTFISGHVEDPILSAPQPDETPARTAAVWSGAIEVLAKLHELSPADLGLADEPVRSPADELAVWVDTARSASLDDFGAAAVLVSGLRESGHDIGRTVVVHGDFRLGNLIVDGAVPVALIDWEIWSVGDPAIDVGWLVQFTDAGNYPGVGRDVPGTPTADAVLEQYCRLTGDDPDRFRWFIALGCLKLAAIQAHNLRRHREGRRYDPLQELLGPSIAVLLRRGADLIAS